MKNLILILSFLFLFVSSVWSGECSEEFSWKPSDPIKTVVGYHIWYGTVSGAYLTIIDVGKPEAQEDGRIYGGVTGLDCGEAYYFVCTAYNDNGDSAKSNEIYVEFAGKPRAPKDFRIED